MPLYEYRCQACAKQFTFLYGVIAGNTEPRCPQCRGIELKKLISRVNRLRGNDAMLDALSDPTKLGDLDDPRNLRKLARTLGRELGADTGEDLSDEFEQLMEKEEHESSGQHGDDGTIY